MIKAPEARWTTAWIRAGSTLKAKRSDLGLESTAGLPRFYQQTDPEAGAGPLAGCWVSLLASSSATQTKMISGYWNSF